MPLGQSGRILLSCVGAVLIVVALMAPRGVVSVAELIVGAGLIAFAYRAFARAPQKRPDLGELPWIKAAKVENVERRLDSADGK